MHFSIPNIGEIVTKTIILDLNGTIAIDGKLIEGVRERIDQLRSLVRLVLFTGDTHGNGADIARALNIELVHTPDAEKKRDAALGMDSGTCAAIGNGRIDLALFQTVRLRIATLQAEGVHIETLLASDIVVPSINDALDLFLKPKRLMATLRM